MPVISRWFVFGRATAFGLALDSEPGYRCMCGHWRTFAGDPDMDRVLWDRVS